MAGYNPNCSKCLKCMTCKGNGTVRTTRSGDRPDGSIATWHETVTCHTCSGRGGKACGKHP